MRRSSRELQGSESRRGKQQNSKLCHDDWGPGKLPGRVRALVERSTRPDCGGLRTRIWIYPDARPFIAYSADHFESKVLPSAFDVSRAGGMDLTFATKPTAQIKSECQIQNSTRIEFASGPMVLTFAKGPPRVGTDVPDIHVGVDAAKRGTGTAHPLPFADKLVFHPLQMGAELIAHLGKRRRHRRHVDFGAAQLFAAGQ
jgi:hypothetical protein